MTALTVTVVGAGIAGLTAAFRLQQRGYSVQLLESRAYPGGRMTQCESGGITYNTGTRLCYSFYREVNKLVSEVGLTAAVKKQPSLNIYCESGRGRYPLALSPDVGLFLSPLLPLREKIRLVRLLPDLLHARKHIDPGWMSTAAGLDDMTLAQYVRQKVGSEFLRHYVEPVFQATRSWDTDEVSPAFFVSTSAQMLFKGYTYNFTEGIGQLCRKLASQLTIRYEARVDRIVRNRVSRDCTVYYDIRGTRYELTSDIVVCAVEGNCVSGILADPQPAEAKFFSRVKYNSLGIVHCLAQSREKSGITFFPRRHPGGLSILEISDSEADAAWPSRLYCQLAPELVQRAQKEAKTNHLLELVRPAISAHCPRLVVDQAHTVNQWIENMLPVFYPGYIGHLRSFLHYQESARHSIYFCGDYLSQALVEGACHSGSRVAESISSHWASRHGN